MRYLDRNKTPLIPGPIVIKAERDGIAVECALWWNDGYHETVLCFTNTIPQRDGGTHLAGFRGALTRQITGYAEKGGGSQKEKVALTGDDCREGLTAVLSVQGAGPEIFLADQGQARLLRGAPGGGEPAQRGAAILARGASRRKPRSSSTRSSRPPRHARPRARRAR